MAILEVIKCGKQELPESFALMKSETLIGRDPKCDISLKWDGMSRVHARIVGSGGDSMMVTAGGSSVPTRFKIEDYGASNGTFVNNVRVRESILRSGDTVAFGRGSGTRVAEVIPERHLEYIFVFRTLQLRGEAAGGEPRSKGTAEHEDIAILHPPCRSHLFPPSWFTPSQATTAGPETELQLDFVHGYRCPTNLLGRKHQNEVAARCENMANCFFLSPGRICYPASGLVVLHDFEENKQEFFTEHTDDVVSLCLHPSLQIAASGQVASIGSLKPPVHVWEVSTKRVLITLKGLHERKVSFLDFNPTGQLLVTVGGDDRHSVAVYAWERSTAPVFFKPGHIEEISTIRHNPFVADEFCQVGKKHVKFWSYKEQDGKISSLRQSHGRKEGESRCEPQCCYCSAYMDNGDCAVGLEDGHILFFKRVDESKPSLPKEAVRRINNAHKGPVISLCSIEYGLVSGGADGMVKIWGEDGGAGGGAQAGGAASRGGASARGGSAQGGSRRGAATSGSSSSTKLLLKFDIKELAADGMQGQIGASSIDYLNKTLLIGTTVGMIAIVRLPDRKNQAPARIIPIVFAHAVACSGLAHSPSGRDYFITASEDCTIKQWSLKKRSLLQSASVGIKALCLAISPDERLIAVGHARGRFTVWDFPAPPLLPKCLMKNTYRREDLTDIKFSPDGRYLAVASREQTIDVYDVPYEFARVGICKGHTAVVMHVDFSADSRYLRSSCAANEVLFWSLPSCKQYGRARDMRDLQWASYSVTFDWALRGMWKPGMIGSSIDSVDVNYAMDHCLAGNDSGEIMLYRYPAQPDSTAKTYTGASTHIHQVKFSVDDDYVVSAVGDGTVMVWRHVAKKSNVPRAAVRRFHSTGGLVKDAVPRPVRQGTYGNEHSRKM